MKNITEKIYEAKAQAYNKFIKDLNLYDFDDDDEENEDMKQKIISFIPDWAKDADVQYIDSQKFMDGFDDDLYDYVTDESNFDFKEVIADASYGEYEISVMWNDKVFFLSVVDGEAILYKRNYK